MAELRSVAVGCALSLLLLLTACSKAPTRDESIRATGPFAMGSDSDADGADADAPAPAAERDAGPTGDHVVTEPREYVFVASGTWGPAEPGHLTSYALDRETGSLTPIDRKQVGGLASFVARHPALPILYVADEELGGVHAVHVEPATGKLTPGEHRGSSGKPVYLSVDAAGTVLLAANYGEGTTVVFPLDRAGAVGEAAHTYATGAKSHAAPIRPGTSHVYVPSLDRNAIAQFRLADGALVPLTPADVPQTGGPRHVAFHPEGHRAYVVSELGDVVGIYAVSAAGTLSARGTARRLPAEHASAPATHTGADVHVTPSGRHAYVTNRGQSNTLARYAVTADGDLTLLGHESTRGETPRNFTIEPAGELLLVGNQDSKNVAIFRIDEASGALTHLETTDVGVSPFFVALWRFEP